MSRNVSIRERSQKILLAEDDQEMRSLIAWTLHKAGYKVTECRNGFELYQRLRAELENSPIKAYDLVLTDICLPGLDAFEVLEDMQSRGECPPIILITSFGDDDTHLRAQRMGAAAMFDKPFDMDDLARAVRKLVSPGSNFSEKNVDSSDSSTWDPNPN